MKIQTTDFSEIVCCPSAVVQRAALRKDILFGESTGGPTAISIQPSGVGDLTTTLRRLLIGAKKNTIFAVTIVN